MKTQRPDNHLLNAADSNTTPRRRHRNPLVTCGFSKDGCRFPSKKTTGFRSTRPTSEPGPLQPSSNHASPQSHPHTPTRSRGFILADHLIAVGLTSVLLTVLLGLTSFCVRSMTITSDYADLELASRNALDVMSRDIRHATALTQYSSTELVFDLTTGGTVSYAYDSDAQTLSRTMDNHTEVLLTDCNTFTFDLLQRNPISGTYDQYPAADLETVKLVQLFWHCSRSLMGTLTISETVQSAKIVMRNT